MHLQCLNGCWRDAFVWSQCKAQSQATVWLQPIVTCGVSYGSKRKHNKHRREAGGHARTVCFVLWPLKDVHSHTSFYFWVVLIDPTTHPLNFCCCEVGRCPRRKKTMACARWKQWQPRGHVMVCQPPEMAIWRKFNGENEDKPFWGTSFSDKPTSVRATATDLSIPLVVTCCGDSRSQARTFQEDSCPSFKCWLYTSHWYPMWSSWLSFPLLLTILTSCRFWRCGLGTGDQPL